jgi:hypothetical protein
MKKYLLFAMLIAAGCSSPPINTNTWVKIYNEPVEPTRPYVRVKLLATHDYLRNRNDVLNKFISKAERINADAIIVYPVEEATIGKSLYKAEAIKWKD